jgi:ABC-type branched-subunit amino acid transport system ATPase component
MLESNVAASLAVQGLSKRFGGVVAADNVTLPIEHGVVTGLIGPNGAGKSTVVNMISGFVHPDSGSIALAGEELAGRPPLAFSRRGIVRTFQHATPIAGMTALENVLVGMHPRYRAGVLSILLSAGSGSEEGRLRAEARGILEDFGLAQHAGTQASDLPFGQLRFLEIARAVAGQPSILLLDEPAAGLDKVETDRLMALIRGICGKRKIGVLLIDHDIRFVLELSRVITVMNFGRVIATGEPRDIEHDKGVRAAYLSTGLTEP